MRVLAYNPESDLFFIGATFDEFSALEAKYKIATVEFSVEYAKQFIDEERRFPPTEGTVSYFNVIKAMYGIEDVPDICFSADRALSALEAMPYDFPFHHMWNAYSPWRHVNIVEINDLHDLIQLQCEERVQDV